MHPKQTAGSADQFHRIFLLLTDASQAEKLPVGADHLDPNALRLSYLVEVEFERAKRWTKISVQPSS